MLKLHLLGTFQVTVEGAPVTGFATDKVRALLAYLVVESDRPHRRDTLAGLLWPDQPDKKSRHNLRQALSHLRQAIDDPDEGGFLHVTRESVQFDTHDVWSDIAEFSTHEETTRRHSHRGVGACWSCLQHLEALVSLYRGDFLKGFSLEDSSEFEEWVLLKREWHHLHVVEALTVLSSYHARRGETAQACDYIRRQVRLEPWREEAHRQLMTLLASVGQRSAAIKQYQVCCSALEEELGVEPTEETLALFNAICSQKSLPGPRPFSGVLSPRLPIPSSSFVGRERELADLNANLAAPDCRLVTLVGPGGIGKSRLAAAVVQTQAGLFEHGRCFVPLAAVTSPSALVPALVDALGISTGPQDLKTQLVDYLRGKNLLLVCDNFEHVLEGADLLVEILREAPGVVLLVTSRERLNVRDEWVYPVGGLSYGEEPPAPDALPDAMALFVQRAAQAGASLNGWAGITVEDFPSVARICQMVGGTPLAIELAAAMSPYRVCKGIADAIALNLDVLTTRMRDMPERHRSIRATFEHSWQLLADAERDVFARLSIFRGGFDLEAAKQVAKASVPILRALLDKSFLRLDAGGRYDVHSLLQKYASEKLADIPEAHTRMAQEHSAHYAAFLERMASQVRGPNEMEAVRAIASEIGNVRRLWEWVHEQLECGGQVHLAFDLAACALEGQYLFYVIFNWYQEGDEQIGRIAADIEAMGPTEVVSESERLLLLGRLLVRQGKCREFIFPTEETQLLYVRSLELFQDLGADSEMGLPLHGMGYIAHMRGEHAQAHDYLSRSWEAFRKTGNLGNVASVLNLLCLVARREGHYAEAKQYCEEALSLRRSAKDVRGMASSLNSLGLVLCALGEYREAQAAFQEGLQLCRDLGYRVGAANTLTGLCQTAFYQDDFAAAERFAWEGLQVYVDIGDRWGTAIAYNNLGYIAMLREEYDRAQDFYRAGIAIYRKAGIKAGLANTLNNLGQACYESGELSPARQYLLEALHIAQETGELPIMLEALTWLAMLLAGEGKLSPALEILAFVWQHSATLSATSREAKESFERLSEGLTPAQIAKFETQAQEQTTEAVVARALAALQ